MGERRRQEVTAPSASTRAALHTQLFAWYGRHKRDLPWRNQPTPYAVLVSEFMLQQTQVDRVAPRFVTFLERFPTLDALAGVPTSEVLRAWSGLGYNVRAVRLQAIAREAMARHGGKLPADVAALRRFRGIGPYTAAAVACFAYGERVATVDTNVRRVLGRLFLGGQTALTASAADQLATALLPQENTADWNQALMDLGATICAARAPACSTCPLQAHCRAYAERRTTGRAIGGAAAAVVPPRREPPFAGSTRYFRGRIVQALTQLAPGEALPLAALGARIAEEPGGYDSRQLDTMIRGLERDGLVSVQRRDDDVRVALPEAAASTSPPGTNKEASA